MESIVKNDEKSAEINSANLITALKNRITELETLVKYYEEQFRLAKHRQFGSSSEKSTHDEQISLFNEAEATAQADVPEPELVEVEKHYRKHKKHKHVVGENLPEDIPVERVEHALPEAEQKCTECGGALHVMGRESRRELKIIPAQVKVIEHISNVYSCRSCESNNDHTAIVKAPMPEPLIKGSYASAESVAHIIEQKYVMGVPLYRQEQEWNRNGVMLSRQTMSNWLIRCAEDWLELVYKRMRTKLLEHEVLHADETTLQVLHEPGKKATSNSYMWVYRTSGDSKTPIVLYEYKPDRGGKHAKEFLKGYVTEPGSAKYLHTDGYSGYRDISEDIVIVGCWAHLRRKFHEALKSLPKDHQKNSTADIGMWYCDALFRMERKYAGYTAEKRYKARMKYSLPLAEDFLLWAESVNALPKSLIGQALNYLREQWIYLKNVYLDGRLEFSNNRIERSIKPFVICRKNFLFANTPKGAKSSAIIYSLLESAKENLLRPFEYFVWLFETIPNTPTSKIDDLLPFSDKIPDFCRVPKKDM